MLRTLRASSSGSGQSGDSQMRSKHTNTVLPMRVVIGNQQFAGIEPLLEEWQQALEQTYRHFGYRRLGSRA